MIVKKVRIGDLVSVGFKPKSKKYWDNLRSSLKDGYRPDSFEHGYIRISRFNNVLDGNHRIHIMKKLYGEDYEINVRVSSYMGLFPFIIYWFNENIKKPLTKHPLTLPNDFYTVESYEGKYELKTIKITQLREFTSLRSLRYITRRRPLISIMKKPMADTQDSLLTEGYKPYEYGFIKIDRQYRVVDGYKRLHILLNRYGNNLELEVMSLVRIPKKRINIKTFFLVFMIVLTLITIITLI